MKVSHQAANVMNKAIQAKDMQSQENAVKKFGDESQSHATGKMLDPSPVTLSQQARQIQKATELAKENTVDEAKVARLQNLIDSGKYQVDAAKIADVLVDEHLKMPS